MVGQITMFEFLEMENKKKFDPVGAFALLGSGFRNGKQRIFDFFSSDSTKKEKAEFLKNEYGIGGFGIPCDKPFVIHEGNTNAKGISVQYYDENMENVKLSVSWMQLASCIEDLIKTGKYMERED